MALAPILELEPNLSRLARLASVSPGAVHYWRRRGLSVRQADRLAILCGSHPVILWPEWEALALAQPLPGPDWARSARVIHGGRTECAVPVYDDAA